MPLFVKFFHIFVVIVKKTGIIILLFFYLIPVVGVTVSAHFCGGKISSISFISTDKHNCPCGSKSMKKNCCKDISAYIKLKNAQHKSILFSINDFKPLLKKFFSNKSDFIVVREISVSDNLYSTFHPPNKIISYPLFLINSVFRI